MLNLGPRSISPFILLCLVGAFQASAQIYVATSGNDSYPGTIDSPYVTIQRAVTAVSAGGLIYVRGGTYFRNTGTTLNKAGTAGQVIRLWAYPGEVPVFDYSPQPRGTSSRGMTLSNSYWHVRGLVIHSAGDNGIYITGSNNTVEACTLFDNEDTGLQISGGGSNNLVVNCDSYANYDSATHGENADGFAPKLDIGPGNVFRGCRAWNNADDGWDIFEGANQVVIDSCWAFHNGYNIWGDPSFQGDGNGFKLGGNYVAGPNLVLRSVAFDNRSKGFDQNNNTAGQTIENCTGYRNVSRNFSFPAAPTTGTHVLKNNIGFSGTNSLAAGTVEVANSWQGFTVTTDDFVSVDTSLATAPRNSDGSLPASGLFRLASGSDLIDGGVDVGLLYNGPAPDLGAFETGAQLPAQPVLSEPADGAAGVSLDVSFRWMHVFSASSYRLQVAEDSLFAALVSFQTGLPDTVRVLSGLQAAKTYYWRVGAANNAGAGPWSVHRRFTTLDSASGVFTYNPDWNLVSLPFDVADGERTAVFPTAVGVAYAYTQDQGYVEADTLHPGTGYWIKFPSDQALTLSGGLRTRDSIQVGSGWSLIGPISIPVPVAGVDQLPPGIIEGSFYGFDGSYTVADSLLPGNAYWVKTSAPGLLILSPQPARPAMPAELPERNRQGGTR